MDRCRALCRRDGLPKLDCCARDAKRRSVGLFWPVGASGIQAARIFRVVHLEPRPRGLRGRDFYWRCSFRLSRAIVEGRDNLSIRVP